MFQHHDTSAEYPHRVYVVPFKVQPTNPNGPQDFALCFSTVDLAAPFAIRQSTPIYLDAATSEEFARLKEAEDEQARKVQP